MDQSVPNYWGVWLLDTVTGLRRPISGDTVFDVAPAWSTDSAKIAFLRADELLYNDYAHSNPELANTNVFVADVNNPTPRRVTNSVGKKNKGLQWTPEGNIIMSSTAEGANGLPGLVIAYLSNGGVARLFGGSQGGSLVHPIIFSR